MSNVGNLLRPRGRVAPLIWLAAAILLAGAVWFARDAYEQSQILAYERAAIARLKEAHRVPPPVKFSREDRERAKRWSAWEAERQFRWYPVFRGLEAANDEEIELLEFAPDKVNRTFVLRGEARDLAALLRYIEALAQQDSFSGAYLAHQKIIRRDALLLVEFEIRGAAK